MNTNNNQSSKLKITQLKQPAQCILWKKEVPTKEDLNWECLEVFDEDSHFRRNILKCKECGQLYFHEFYEEVNWGGGDDKMYDTYIPVKTEEEIKILADTKEPLELLVFYPRLQRDFTGGVDQPMRWVGSEKPIEKKEIDWGQATVNALNRIK